jgi:hypothetical protein
MEEDHLFLTQTLSFSSNGKDATNYNDLAELASSSSKKSRYCQLYHHIFISLSVLLL